MLANEGIAAWPRHPESRNDSADREVARHRHADRVRRVVRPARLAERQEPVARLVVGALVDDDQLEMLQINAEGWGTMPRIQRESVPRPVAMW